MAIAQIAMPFIRHERTGSSPAVQKVAVPEKATPETWLAGALVQLTAGAVPATLTVCPTAGVLCFGQSPDAAKGSSTPSNLLTPPYTLFGLNHFVFDVKDRIIEINAAAALTNVGTTNGVTWAGGGTGGVALAAGQKYGLLTGTTGTYNKYQFMDVTNTTNLFFEVVGLAPFQSVDDNNPRVLVKILDAVLQN
jgi:hypothetical protein